jgi:hypothetical protein
MGYSHTVNVNVEYSCWVDLRECYNIIDFVIDYVL